MVVWEFFYQLYGGNKEKSNLYSAELFQGDLYLLVFVGGSVCQVKKEMGHGTQLTQVTLKFRNLALPVATFNHWPVGVEYW